MGVVLLGRTKKIGNDFRPAVLLLVLRLNIRTMPLVAFGKSPGKFHGIFHSSPLDDGNWRQRTLT